jgi:hypothetical protein
LACDEYNWSIRSPFSAATEKLKELKDRELQEQERQAALCNGANEEEGSICCPSGSNF